MPSFRKGFRAEVSELVAELRKDYGARQLDPVDPISVAVWMDIPVLGISAGLSADVDEAVRGLVAERKFHAATVPHGTGFVIFHNDYSSPERQRSDVAHELGHVLLEHEFRPINRGLIDDRSPEVEREADWFGFSLLVPDEAALALARSNLPVDECANLMGTSVQAMQYRLNTSGALKRAARERRNRRL